MKYAPPIGQEAQGEEAHYVDGNPELGILGSPVPAAAIEQGQRELLHVIKQAGLTPSSEDLTQLFQAIGQLITNAKPGLATKAKPGLVQVGSGLDVTAQGLLSVLTATLEQNGIMRPDGTTCTVENGVLKVLQQTSDYMEEWRKSWIGVPRYWRSTTLPANHCWANGDAVLFADWPELKAVYDAGGFEGMLLPWDASSEQQAANLGKWRPNALNPTGLYTPALSGQFFRNWAQGADAAAGIANTDTGRNITGSVNFNNLGVPYLYEAFFPLGGDNNGGEPSVSSKGWASNFSFDASRVWKEHTGQEFAPIHVWQPVILYLGRPAQV